MKNNKILFILAILITMDYATTFVGVLYMDAIELNPLYQFFNNNLYHWFMFKFTAGIFCLGTLAFIDGEENNRIIGAGLIILTLFYLFIVSSNLIQIYMNL